MPVLRLLSITSLLLLVVSGAASARQYAGYDHPAQFSVKPNFDLRPGRSRTNCTLPSSQPGRFHWYSHNWFVRKADGSWYGEY